jgi:hypothetical protein
VQQICIFGGFRNRRIQELVIEIETKFGSEDLVVTADWI